MNTENRNLTPHIELHEVTNETGETIKRKYYIFMQGISGLTKSERCFIGTTLEDLERLHNVIGNYISSQKTKGGDNER